MQILKLKKRAITCTLAVAFLTQVASKAELTLHVDTTGLVVWLTGSDTGNPVDGGGGNWLVECEGSVFNPDNGNPINAVFNSTATITGATVYDSYVDIQLFYSGGDEVTISGKGSGVTASISSVQAS